MANTKMTVEEVAQHNSESDCWMTIDGKVYDVTKFLKLHPGGKQFLLQYGGKDATKAFYALHNHNVLQKYSKRLYKGYVADSEIDESWGYVNTDVPYKEPIHERNDMVKSPFYDETHEAFRRAVRKFLCTEILPDAEEGEETGEYPEKELWQAMGKCGFLASRIGVAAMPAAKKMKLPLPADVSYDKFDFFHELIAHEEMGRLMAPGFSDGLGAGFCIGLPPMLHFALPALRDKIVPEVLSGDKQICLAISEPQCGSDVANMVTTATKSPCGKFYFLTGVKKWITNGMFCDYFVTAARTGGKGMGGVSLFLVERSEGLETKPIKTAYSSSAGTSLVIYDRVKVPIENLLGKENEGFKCIMANFNHERWFIIAMLQGSMRYVVNRCFQWAQQREAFGKPLTAQPVIRFKLAKMIAAVEGQQAYLESLTHQMNKMDYRLASMKLGGPLGFLKYQATRIAEMLSDESCQIFGGRGITQTGMGKDIERFRRSVKFAAILGGSEEIMADLGVRQAMREWPRESRL